MKTFAAPFAQTPRTATAVCTAAGTFVDDAPTNTQLLLTAGTDGALLTKLNAMPRSTCTATALFLFLSKDGGTTKRLVDSRLMASATLSTSAAIPMTPFNYAELSPLRLEAGDKLYASMGVALAAGVVFKAEYTDY